MDIRILSHQSIAQVVYSSRSHQVDGLGVWLSGLLCIGESGYLAREHVVESSVEDPLDLSNLRLDMESSRST